MKRRYSRLLLILPTLMILGIHSFSHPQAVIASASLHERLNQGSDTPFTYAGLHHDLALAKNSHLLVADAGFSANRTIHEYGGKGSVKAWAGDEWGKGGKWDQQARQDMRARIARKGSEWFVRENSFGKQAAWLPGWELRWWSFSDSDGRTVWAYHARSKASGARYTSITDDASGKLQTWEAVN